MKVLFLNAWGLRQANALMSFLGSSNTPPDIICLTEMSHLQYAFPERTVRHAGKSGGPTLLDSHRFIAEKMNRVYEHRFDTSQTQTWECADSGDTYHNVGYGSSLLYRRSGQFRTLQKGSELVMVSDENDEHSKVLQWICVQTNDSRYLIAHYHGLWIKGNTKGDHPLRDAQSKQLRVKLMNLMKKTGAKKLVFGGDLNLDHDTMALKRLVGWGNDWSLVNQNEAFQITGTRTPLFRDYNTPGVSRHADYVLTTPNVEVSSYIVDTNVLASDHAPLAVTFK
jgi:exonuclease III